jgi:hypothetical protein
MYGSYLFEKPATSAMWGKWHSLCSQVLGVAHFKREGTGALVRSELTEKETHHETHTLSYSGSSP